MQGVNLYLIFSLIVFMVVFASAIIYIMIVPKETIKSISELPLNDKNNYE